MKQYGVDGRFNSFVVQTMFWTVIGGLAALGADMFFKDGPDGGIGSAMIVVIYGFVVASLFGVLSYCIWIVPSALIFGRSFHRARRTLSETTAAMIAGTVTALVASMAFYVIATLVSQDFDGIHVMIILFGPISLFVAPVIAYRIYRAAASQRSPGDI